MIKLSFNRWLKYLSVATAIAGMMPTADAGKITEDLQGKLVIKGSGRELVAHSIDPEPPLYVFLFSASWCPPCNQQMPGLIASYKKLKKKSPDGFEFILVSADHSAKDMQDYIIGKSMPWPALAYDQRDAAAAAKAFSGEGIPSLILMTKDGRFINGSYSNKGSGDYQGLPPVLESLEKLLGAGGDISPEAVEGAADAANAAAEKLGISRTRLSVALILAAGTFLYLFYKN